MALEIDATDRICITGLPRTGKTTFMRWLLTLPAPNIYIMDPLDQYEQFGEVGDVLADGKRCIPLLSEGRQRFEQVAQRLHNKSNITLAVEEAEQFIPQQYPLLPYTSSLIQAGRNWGIGIWCITRRIQGINKVFFDLAQRVFFFRCGFKSREYIADMIGKEYMYPIVSPKYNKTGYTITTLPPFHFLDFNLETETAIVRTLKLGGIRSEVKEMSKKSEVKPEKPKAEEKDTKVEVQPAEKGEEVTAKEKGKTALWTPGRK